MQHISPSAIKPQTQGTLSVRWTGWGARRERSPVAVDSWVEMTVSDRAKENINIDWQRVLMSWGDERYLVQLEAQARKGEAGHDDKEQTLKVFFTFFKLAFLKV